MLQVLLQPRQHSGPRERKQMHAHAHSTPLLPLHTRTHTLGLSQSVIGFSVGCTLWPWWLLGHPGFDHGAMALQLEDKNKCKGAFRRLLSCPETRSPPVTSLGTRTLGAGESWKSVLHGPQSLGMGCCWETVGVTEYCTSEA